MSLPPFFGCPPTTFFDVQSVPKTGKRLTGLAGGPAGKVQKGYVRLETAQHHFDIASTREAAQCSLRIAMYSVAIRTSSEPRGLTNRFPNKA